MNILVTGSTGFLGQHLCRKLTADGHEVVGVSSTNCDLIDQGVEFCFPVNPPD